MKTKFYSSLFWQIEVLPRLTIIKVDCNFIIAIEWLFWGSYVDLEVKLPKQRQ